MPPSSHTGRRRVTLKWLDLAKVEEFNRNFDEEFFLIACMESTIGSNICYIDSGASSHMIEKKRLFRDLQEGGTWIHVEMGDDAGYQEQEFGTVSFERESRKPLSFADVLYVPGLTKNLISVSTLEEKGY